MQDITPSKKPLEGYFASLPACIALRHWVPVVANADVELSFFFFLLCPNSLFESIYFAFQPREAISILLPPRASWHLLRAIIIPQPPFIPVNAMVASSFSIMCLFQEKLSCLAAFQDYLSYIFHFCTWFLLRPGCFLGAIPRFVHWGIVSMSCQEFLYPTPLVTLQWSPMTQNNSRKTKSGGPETKIEDKLNNLPKIGWSSQLKA